MEPASRSPRRRPAALAASLGFAAALVAAAWAGPKGGRRELVLDENFPDPTVIRASDGRYYAYATGGGHGGRPIRVQVARSADLEHWTYIGEAMPRKPAWAEHSFWAPDVSEHGGTYYLYFAANPGRHGLLAWMRNRDGFCIGAATSRSPLGPFTPQPKPLVCGNSFVNIDPMSFDDPATGRRFLYWGSGYQAIRMRELAKDRLSFANDRTVMLVPPGGAYQKLVEGAWVLRHGGYYYLFYSGDNCCVKTPHYAVLVARARWPWGPYEKHGTILEADERWLAPGHNSVVQDASGRYWMFYHAIDARRPTMRPGGKSVRRVMLRSRIRFENGWPVVD